MFRFFCIILLAAASLSASPVYQATYNNGSAGNDGSYIIGLTQLTLMGPQGSTTFDSMCFDFAEHISNGQQYQATATQLTAYSNDQDTQAKYDMAGFIYLAMHNLPAVVTALNNSVSPDVALQGLQYGVWDLFEPESEDGNIYHGFAYTTQVDGAVDQMLENPGALATFTAGLKQTYPGALDNLYVVQGYGPDQSIQKFIIGGQLPGGVPEPGSLGLMGGGLIGLAMLIRKRALR
jgi:PEP-CTERM motif